MKDKYEKLYIELYKRTWIEEIYKEIDILNTMYPIDFLLDEYFSEILPKVYDKGVLVIKYKNGKLKRVVLWDKYGGKQ